MSDYILDQVVALPPELPPELSKLIFSHLHPTLQTLCKTGHIICTKSCVIPLPKGLSVKVLAVGSGGAATVSYPAINTIVD